MDLHGTNGMLHLTRGEWKLDADRVNWDDPKSEFRTPNFKNEAPGADQVAHLAHVQNFLDCVRSRQLTVANPVVMYRSMSTVHAANICMWLGRSLKFDPVKAEFLNDPEANRLRSRAMREPWII